MNTWACSHTISSLSDTRIALMRRYRSEMHVVVVGNVWERNINGYLICLIEPIESLREVRGVCCKIDGLCLFC